MRCPLLGSAKVKKLLATQIKSAPFLETIKYLYTFFCQKRLRLKCLFSTIKTAPTEQQLQIKVNVVVVVVVVVLAIRLEREKREIK